MKKKILNSLLCISIFMAGCGTILTKDIQNISLSSKPPGADVRIGPYTGITPCVLQIPKGKTYAIDVMYDDEKQSVPLTKTIAGTSLINILFPLGFIVDAITGKVQKYKPTEYHFDFNE